MENRPLLIILVLVAIGVIAIYMKSTPEPELPIIGVIKHHRHAPPQATISPTPTAQNTALVPTWAPTPLPTNDAPQVDSRSKEQIQKDNLKLSLDAASHQEPEQGSEEGNLSSSTADEARKLDPTMTAPAIKDPSSL